MNCLTEIDLVSDVDMDKEESESEAWILGIKDIICMVNGYLATSSIHMSQLNHTPHIHTISRKGSLSYSATTFRVDR